MFHHQGDERPVSPRAALTGPRHTELDKSAAEIRVDDPTRGPLDDLHQRRVVDARLAGEAIEVGHGEDPCRHGR